MTEQPRRGPGRPRSPERTHQDRVDKEIRRATMAWALDEITDFEYRRRVADAGTVAARDIFYHERQRIIAEADGCCEYCDPPLPATQIDHAIPVACGGTSDRDGSARTLREIARAEERIAA